MILSTHSYIKDDKVLQQTLQSVSAELDQIFKLARNELIQAEIKKTMLDYSSVLGNSECAKMLQEMFLNKQYTGNLTPEQYSNSTNGDDSNGS